MGITIPGYHLKSKRDLREMRHRLKGGHGRRELATELILTSMVDMFAVLIFFLMNTFGASGDFEFINPDVDLPSSEHARELKRAPIITVFADKVIIEGGEPDSNYSIEGKIEETDWELPKLQEKLLEYKKFFESVHTDVKYPPEVIVQADKELDFLYIKRVLFTLTKIGFSGVNLAVRGRANIQAEEAAVPPGSP